LIGAQNFDCTFVTLRAAFRVHSAENVAPESAAYIAAYDKYITPQAPLFARLRAAILSAVSSTDQGRPSALENGESVRTVK